MATRRKLRKAGKSSRKHQKTFRRKNRVKRNSKRRRRVMRGGKLTLCNAQTDTNDCCDSKRSDNDNKDYYCNERSCNTNC